MVKILVGSLAAELNIDDNAFRVPKDVDYFAPEPVQPHDLDSPDRKIETFWHQRIEDNLETLIQYCWKEGEDSYVANIDFLYTLKVSHSFWEQRNGSWPKHMHDIRWFQENTDAQHQNEIYEIFYPIWEERYGKKRANLNVAPEDFFTKTVNRTYDHDSIHATVAYYDKPLFNKILRDGQGVAVDRNKFNRLSMEKKYQLVREECYATALERMIIPSGYTESPRRAYHWALKKTITSFSKGWFPLFIVLNYSKLAKPDVDYVKVHLDNKDKLILL